MSVALAYALHKGVPVHISKRLSKEASLYCPHCQEAVIARKGVIKEHHFAHKPGSNCAATSESVLHYESKMYLHHLINEKKALYFQLERSFLPKDIRQWMDMLNQRTLEVSLQTLVVPHRMNVVHASVEKALGGYIPDVSIQSKQPIAFELFVTHAMEEEKKNAYKEQQINWLEFIPSRNPDGTFSFTVHSCYLPVYFSVWQKDIQQTFERDIKPLVIEGETEQKPKVVKEIAEKIAHNIDRFYIAHGDKFTKKEVFHQIQSNEDVVIAEELPFGCAKIIKSDKHGFMLLGKETWEPDTYMVTSPMKFFQNFLNELNQHYPMTMGIDAKGRIVSFTLTNTADTAHFTKDMKTLIRKNIELLVDK